MMPFQRTQNTVPADPEYRSSGPRIPFQRTRYPQAELILNREPARYRVILANSPNHF